MLWSKLVAIIINPHLHGNFKETRNKFLKRVSCVKAIRTNKFRGDEGLTLYVHSLPTFNLYRYIKNAIDKGDFSGLDSYYGDKHFGMEISDKLFTWFKNNELDTITRQVICWLSLLYWLEPSKREIMDRQLYMPIAEKVRKVYSIYFTEEIDISSIEWEKAQNHTEKFYHSACLDYYGSLPPEIMKDANTHLQKGVKEMWWFHNTFDIRLNRFYFRYDDWERIIINQKEDDLLRAESSKDLWLTWKHQFAQL